ncbi:MAG: outer membrane exchange protein TraA [Myxococcaceae bacterium]|nr:outer membrane exchange protein TraA [Myxococcaceae bacterium]
MVLVCLAGSAWADFFPPSKLDDVVVTGDPVAPSPSIDGTGLCSAEGISTDPNKDFPQESSAFIASVNQLLDSSTNRETYVLRTPFDLSNNLDDGRTLSYGDFVNVVPGCPMGGCNFRIIPAGNSSTYFGSRLRGYLNVTPEMIDRVLHFGIYADQAVTLTIYDRNSVEYPVIKRPTSIAAVTWRSTNSVTFKKSGLYPIEILYAQIIEHAALELSIFDDTVTNFEDFERAANDPPVVNLNGAKFTLVPPEKFFQTETGRPSFSDENQCAQCERRFANAPGNGGCGLGFYCNGAALCAPCDTSRVCGPSCSPCGQSTPNCVNVNGTFTCVECTDDTQCGGRRCDLTTNTCTGCLEDRACPNGQVCDKTNYTCVECNRDEDCPPDEVCAPEIKQCRECNEDAECERGKSCQEHQCITCTTNDSCAGNSCNCCPAGTQCSAPTPGASPSCVECTTDSQCADGKKCDALNGRCVDAIAECNTSDRCGSQCVKCPGDRPFCLDGQVCVACRNDLECASGQFCQSGECTACTTDRHCGPRCGACERSAPFCVTDGTTAGSVCVACRNDSDCPGSTCDPATFTCVDPIRCGGSCTAQGKVCNGTDCVECFADAHCPCGGTCDVSTGTCTTSCNDSGDCLGVEYCSTTTQECERGRRKPGTSPQGGSFCCETTTTADITSTGTGAFLAMLLVGFLLLYSRRAL